MESYYSSDEEIAWGPVTLREIKGDLKRPVRKPKKRHTIHPNFNMDSESIHCDLPKKKDEDMMLCQEVSTKLNISTTSTEYYTPNESLRANNNSDFIEKLSKVINEPHSDLSMYTSVLEHSKSSLSTNIQTSNEEEPTKTSNISSQFVLSDTCLNFIKSANERETAYEIANFQQTLVENSVILSESEDIDKSQCSDIEDRIEDLSDNQNLIQEKVTEDLYESQCSNDEDGIENLSMDPNLIQEKVTEDLDESQCSNDEDGIENLSMDQNYLQEKVTDEDVIVITDDEESFIMYITDEKDDIENVVKTEISFETERSGNSFEHDSLGNSRFEENANNKSMIESSSSNEETSTVEQEYEFEQNDFEDNAYQLPEKLSTIEEKESLNTSLVSVPEIDLKQFDYSYNDSLHLDDTLEEMSRALKQGLEYRMSDEEKVIEETPVKTVKLEPIFTPINIISSSSSQKPQLDGASGVKEKTYKTPLKSIQPTSTEKNRTFVYNSKISPNPMFKVPNMPFRQKPICSPTPPKCVLNHPKSFITPPKAGTSNFKNIVSPVALYIKNSPSVRLKQNVPTKVLSKIPNSQPSKICSKENFSDFPDVVYKPAKNKKQLPSHEKEIILPPSIKRLNVKEPHLIKHEGRVKQTNLNRSAVNTKLLQSDITHNSIDSSMLNNSSDISVLTNKQAFIK